MTNMEKPEDIKPTWEVRTDEPEYAFLPSAQHPAQNQYGKSIELVNQQHELANQSLKINNNPVVSENPDR